MTSFDPNHPLHRASFYIEDLKWGRDRWDGPDADPAITAIGQDAIVAQIEMLLRDVDLDLDAEGLRAATDHYAESFAKQFGVSELVARSIFVDGLLHGIALKAGMEGDIPEVYRDPS